MQKKKLQKIEIKNVQNKAVQKKLLKNHKHVTYVCRDINVIIPIHNPRILTFPQIIHEA